MCWTNWNAEHWKSESGASCPRWPVQQRTEQHDDCVCTMHVLPKYMLRSPRNSTDDTPCYILRPGPKCTHDRTGSPLGCALRVARKVAKALVGVLWLGERIPLDLFEPRRRSSP